MAPSAQQRINITKQKLNCKSSQSTRYTWSVTRFNQKLMLELQPVTILFNSTFFFFCEWLVRGIVLSCTILLRNETRTISHSWVQGTRGMWRFFVNGEGWTCSPLPSCPGRRFFSAKKNFWRCITTGSQLLHFSQQQKLKHKSSTSTRYAW
jgi:hypothetical protein